MRVLTVNAGSSSLKLRVLDESPGSATGFDDCGSFDDLEAALAVDGVDAVGHRFVHGGDRVAGPTRVTDDVLADLDRLTPLAPLHQPTALAAARQVQGLRPDLPQVVCPDTAFHHDLPPAAATPAVPWEWREQWGLRRYGFHGLSVQWAVRRVARLDPSARRLVVAHLGSGASLTAVLDGRSVDTTMGFTPLDGLVMATRSGSLDPGLVLWLVQQGMAPHDVVHALETRSGLLALTGTDDLGGTKDMREVLRRRASGDEVAEAAYQVYAHRLRGQLAAMVAALGGLDVLVLTGGIGERSAEVRATAVESLGFLGLALDDAANQAAAEAGCPDDVADLTDPSSTARVLVVSAREDVEIARGTCEALSR